MKIYEEGKIIILDEESVINKKNYFLIFIFLFQSNYKSFFMLIR